MHNPPEPQTTNPFLVLRNYLACSVGYWLNTSSPKEVSQQHGCLSLPGGAGYMHDGAARHGTQHAGRFFRTRAWSDMYRHFPIPADRKEREVEIEIEMRERKDTRREKNTCSFFVLVLFSFCSQRSRMNTERNWWWVQKRQLCTVLRKTSKSLQETDSLTFDTNPGPTIGT